MVSTTVLVSAVFAGFGSVVTLVLALVRQMSARMGDLTAQIHRLDDSINHRFDRHEAILVRTSEDVVALRAAVAGLDARVATLERR